MDYSIKRNAELLFSWLGFEWSTEEGGVWSIRRGGAQGPGAASGCRWVFRRVGWRSNDVPVQSEECRRYIFRVFRVFESVRRHGRVASRRVGISERHVQWRFLFFVQGRCRGGFLGDYAAERGADRAGITV